MTRLILIHLVCWIIILIESSFKISEIFENSLLYVYVTDSDYFIYTWAQGYKTCFMLNSADRKI